MDQNRDSLGSLVDRFMGAMHRYDQGRTLTILHSAKVTTPQLAVLEFVREPRMVSTVATYLGLSRPATSQLVDKLVRADLVRRIVSTTDRRQRNVILSAKGKALLDRIAAARAGRFSSALSALPAPIADRFELVLVDVIQAMDAMPDHESNQTPRSASRSPNP